MTLQQILFGSFTPPLASNVIRHSMMIDKGKKEKPHVPLHDRSEIVKAHANRMYELVKQNPGICSVDLAKKMKMSTARVYVIRDILYGQKMIEGIRGKPLKRGGPKTTLFYAKG